MTIKEKTIKKWNDGVKEWKCFCELMEEYPNLSYQELNLILNKKGI